MSKIEQLKEYLEPKEETWIYEDGDELSEEELFLIRNATAKQKMNLFKRNEKNGKPSEYNVSYTCSECGKEINEKWTKTNILDKTKDLICKKCIEKKEYEREFQRRIDKLEYEKKKIENTKNFIETYLDERNDWKEGLKQWEKWQSLSYANVDYEIIAKHIRGMEYHTFLMTPYWKAVSGQVKKRNDYKCQLCGKQGLLNVHHPDYSIHGYEVQNINKLLCLCNECHNKFHKENKQPN